MTAPVLMVVGTASSVGKSTLVTALCRIAARRGLRVAPFKAQNMSNNAAVTADGAEIARSTAVQAAAARIAPTAAMNPVLIKPEGDRRSQIVVEGRPWRSLDAMEYWQRKQMLWEIVARNLDGLRQSYDLVIAEGAGSPVELNLKAHDITNMRVASYAGARTLLVGDIDAGGIFAAMLGTLMLLEPDERALLRGLIVNRFRGDPALFADGIRILEQRGGLPVLGVVPWIERLGIAEEDAVALERPAAAPRGGGGLRIAVIRLPAIANFDDFDALAAEPGVTLRYVDDPADLAGAAAVILPGTKHTLAARRWLAERGFDRALADFAGGIAGICGGYQILGERIDDPAGVEGLGGGMAGLGLLPVTTLFAADKRTRQAAGASRLPWADGLAVAGYEIHMGRTTAVAAREPVASPASEPQGRQPALILDGRADGHSSADGRIWGCYLHGIFDNREFRRAWLGSLGWREALWAAADSTNADPYERLADTVEAHLDPSHLDALLRNDQ